MQGVSSPIPIGIVQNRGRRATFAGDTMHYEASGRSALRSPLSGAHSSSLWSCSKRAIWPRSSAVCSSSGRANNRQDLNAVAGAYELAAARGDAGPTAANHSSRPT